MAKKAEAKPAPDEQTGAPAQADEAASAPAQGGGAEQADGGIDWQGFLKTAVEKDAERMEAKPAEKAKGREGGNKPPIAPEDGEIEDDPDAVPLELADAEPATEDGEEPLALADGDVDDQSGPADGADAAEPEDELEPEAEEPVEARPLTRAEAIELRARLKETERTNAELLELKGRLGQRVGDLQRQLENRPIDPSTGQPKELSDEERAQNVNQELALFMELGPAEYHRRVMMTLARDLEQNQRETAIAQAPDEGFKKFRIRYKDRIGADPVAWAKGPIGQSVGKILSQKYSLRTAFQAAKDSGDPDGIAQVLSEAYDLHLARTRVPATMKARETTRQRVEAKKSASVPGTPRRRPQGGAINVFEPKNWQRVLQTVGRATR